MAKRCMKVGSVELGGGYVSIQSMTNTRTSDIDATLEQISLLKKAGCELIRITIPDIDSAAAIKELKKYAVVPLIADVHFDRKLALMALENGIDKLRINPGNMNVQHIRSIAESAKEKSTPIRVGANSGSLSKDIIDRFGGISAKSIVESALEHVSYLEQCGFYDIVVSVKSSSVPLSIESYRLLNERCPYPLHVGITEAGTRDVGIIKSAIGIGSLLLDGIGDTIRVSLTGDPVHEVYAAKTILKSIGLRQEGIEVISCPTCGRCSIDIEGIALRVQNEFIDEVTPLKIAVMGCVVNGPGEASHADIGIAGGEDFGLIFMEGKPRKKVPAEELADTLLTEVKELIKLKKRVK